MSSGFPELVIGGVFITPFVAYAFAAVVIVALLRPMLRLVGFERAFSNPPLALLCIYVMVLAALLALL